MPRSCQYLPVVLIAIGCTGRGPDPSTAIPADADAVVAMRSATEVAAALRPVLDRLPVGSGVTDLVRSVSGIDLTNPERSRESGIDPNRGMAAAFWTDGRILVVLPSASESLAERRLALRLARLGFVERAHAGAGARSFERSRDGGIRAALRVSRGLAFVGFGKAGIEDLVDAARANASDPAVGREWATELGMEEAVASGVVRNRLLADLLRRAGIPVDGPAGEVALALAGDIRFALDVRGGARLRVAAGPPGNPFGLPSTPEPSPNGIAALVAVRVPRGPGLDAVVTGLSSLRGEWYRSIRETAGTDPTAVLREWSGAAGIAVVTPESMVNVPIVPDERMLARTRIVGAARLGREDAASAALGVVAALGAASGMQKVDWPVGLGRGHTATGRGGEEVSAAADGDRLIVGWGPASFVSVKGLSEASGTLVSRALLGSGAAGEPVLRVRVDPTGVLAVLGGGGVEFVRHTLGALRMVFADVYVDSGRAVADMGVLVRD